MVEIDPQEDDSPELKAWCAEQGIGRPDLAKIRQQFEADKAAALKLKAELAAQATHRESARQAEQLAAKLREQALANMSAQDRQIETLRQQCEELDVRITGGNFKKQAYSAGSPGPLYKEAAKLIKQASETADWSASEKAALAEMLEQWLPKVTTPWDVKDQRKKLKLSTLRGQSGEAK